MGQFDDLMIVNNNWARILIQIEQLDILNFKSTLNNVDNIIITKN